MQMSIRMKIKFLPKVFTIQIDYDGLNTHVKSLSKFLKQFVLLKHDFLQSGR